MTSVADTQAVDFTAMMNDTRFSITLEDGLIRLSADSMAVSEVFNMGSEPVEDFNGWDHKHKQVYLVGYMDARTDQPYMYDFEAPAYQKCYEAGRTHGETDGIWIGDEDESDILEEREDNDQV